MNDLDNRLIWESVEDDMHQKRVEGYNKLRQEEHRCDILSKVHQLIDHRLQNILLYLNREVSNKEEISLLVQEIQNGLNKIK